MSFDPRRYSSVPSACLNDDICFHIIHITNISKSWLSQLDDWKEFDDPNSIAVDRLANSNNKAGKVIREINMEDSGSMVATSDKFKLMLCDSHNNYCFAYEMDHPLPFLRNSTSRESPLPVKLGGRLVVKKGTTIQNGVLLLTPKNCNYLGLNALDSDLIQKLNNGIVKKNIELLENQLRQS
jgi:RecQ-mediated genome instability protein 1